MKKANVMDNHGGTTSQSASKLKILESKKENLREVRALSGDQVKQPSGITQGAPTPLKGYDSEALLQKQVLTTNEVKRIKLGNVSLSNNAGGLPRSPQSIATIQKFKIPGSIKQTGAMQTNTSTTLVTNSNANNNSNTYNTSGEAKGYEEDYSSAGGEAILENIGDSGLEEDQNT